MSGWERIELGYVTPIVPTTDGETAILGDFIKDGDIVKIPVPFDNPSSSTFFLVENHQRDSPYDQIIRGGAIGGAHNFTTTLGSGVYIWLITSGDSHPIKINPKTTDGSWEWTYAGDYEVGEGWFVGNYYFNNFGFI